MKILSLTSVMLSDSVTLVNAIPTNPIMFIIIVIYEWIIVIIGDPYFENFEWPHPIYMDRTLRILHPNFALLNRDYIDLGSMIYIWINRCFNLIYIIGFIFNIRILMIIYFNILCFMKFILFLLYAICTPRRPPGDDIPKFSKRIDMVIIVSLIIIIYLTYFLYTNRVALFG